MQIDTENSTLTLETADVLAAILHYCDDVLGVKIDTQEDDGRVHPIVIDCEFEDSDNAFSVEFDLQISESQGAISLGTSSGDDA